MNIVPSNAFFIGDGGSNELFGAKQCGMTTVLTEHLLPHEAQNVPNCWQIQIITSEIFSELLELFPK